MKTSLLRAYLLAGLTGLCGNAYAEAPLSDEQTKAALNGAIEARAHYLGEMTMVKITTKRLYHTPQEKQKALQAAKLIQRDVANFCQASCTAEAMLEPLVLRNGQLIFSLRFKGLGRQLFQEELQALLQGQPRQVTEPERKGLLRTSTATPTKGLRLSH